MSEKIVGYYRKAKTLVLIRNAFPVTTDVLVVLVDFQKEGMTMIDLMFFA